MNLTTRVAAAAAGLVLLASGAIVTAGATFAQEPTPAPSPQANPRQERRTDFLNRLVQNLGTTVDQFTAAVKQAELQTVDDLVADGTLTADQAGKIKEKINTGNGLGLGRFLGARRAASRGVKVREAVRRDLGKTAAQAIGIPPADLRKELQGGKSIADVAGERNVPLDTVKSAILAEAKSKLDQAVTAGKITQARADTALQNLTDNLDKILNRKRGA